jgi:hypothetical protein
MSEEVMTNVAREEFNSVSAILLPLVADALHTAKISATLDEALERVEEAQSILNALMQMSERATDEAIADVASVTQPRPE